MFPRIEAFGLPTWAVFVTAGVVLCWVLLLGRTGRLGYPRLKVYVWVLTAFPVGALGAGLTASVVRMLHGDATAPGLGFGANGMTVLGAVIACGVYSWAYIRFVLKTPAWPLLDAVAFTYPLALAFGRVGCLMNGCCYGRTTDAAMGPLTLEVGALDPLTVGGAHYALVPATTPIWNLPIILATFALIAVAITEVVYRRRERWGLPAGSVIVVALVADNTSRFFAEFLRQEEATTVLSLNPWQTVVLVFWLVSVSALLTLVRRRRRTPTSEPSEPLSIPS